MICSSVSTVTMALENLPSFTDHFRMKSFILHTSLGQLSFELAYLYDIFY